MGLIEDFLLLLPVLIKGDNRLDCVCLCVRACMCMCMRVRVCACMHATKGHDMGCIFLKTLVY